MGFKVLVTVVMMRMTLWIYTVKLAMGGSKRTGNVLKKVPRMVAKVARAVVKVIKVANSANGDIETTFKAQRIRKN